MMHQPVVRALCLAALVAVAGCRGMRSEDPPIHPNLNMDYQEKFQPQEANPFFADNAAMRPPVPGTVARGFLAEDPAFYQGRTPSGEYTGEMPVPATRELQLRGQERYDIFCTVCHGQAGFGQGIIMTGNYGYTPAPSYHEERLREASDGYLYDVITNGVRNMPGYAQQIPVADRWAIVAYVRALQRSQNATEEDIPPSVLARIAQGSSANMNAARMGTGGTGAASDSAQADSSQSDAAQGDTTAAAPDTAQSVAAPDTAQNDVLPADTAQAADTMQANAAQANAAEADTAAAPADTAQSAAPGDTASAATQSDTTAAGDAAQGSGSEAGTAGGQAPAAAAAGASAAGGGSSLGLVQIFALFLLGLFLLAAIGIAIVAWRRPKDKDAVAH